MQAVLSGPIVTDYVPAVKPPWVLLVLVVGLFALVMPRDVLPEFCLASVLVGLGGVVANRVAGWWNGDSEADEPPGSSAPGG